MTEITKVQAPQLPSEYISFEYSRGVRALIGQWRARVVLPSLPVLGTDWTVTGFMENGLITEASEVGTTPMGQTVYDIAGYDAGFRLMKSPPLSHQLSSSQLGGVIQEIAEACGLEADVTLEQFTELDFRHCVNGQTAANAILDLAMLGGSVAYITPQGKLRITPPHSTSSLPSINLRLGEARSTALDMEGYASAVMLVLHRRGDMPEEESEVEVPSRKPWTGTTPPGVLNTVSRSGTTALPGGTLSWNYRMLEPIGALVYYSAALYLPGAGIRKAYISQYEYDVKTAVIRVEDQEQRVWKWGLTKMESVEDSVFDVTYYDATAGSTKNKVITQQTSSELHREYDNDLTQIKTEWSETKSQDSGAAKLPFPRPYDNRTEKVWNWENTYGDYRGLTVTEYTYEEMDVGVADTVRNEDGSPLKHVHNGAEWFIRIPGTQITLPVRKEKITQTDEILDRKTGRVVSRIERSTDDQGRRDMLARGLYSDIYSSELERELALAWLRSLPQRAEIKVAQMPGSSVISSEVSTLSQAGRRFNIPTDFEKNVYRYLETITGEGRCPFLLSNKSCGVFNGLEAPSFSSTPSYDIEGWTGEGVETKNGSIPSYQLSSQEEESTALRIPCDYFDEETEILDPNYTACPKYQALRHLVGFSGGSTTATPVVGIAGNGQIYYEKEVYFDEYLTENTARKCAQQMANNILKSKQASRGVVETVELPLNTRVSPDGSILSVRHDFEALRTVVTYLPQESEPPEYLMLLSAGGVALNLYERESVGKARSGIGRVVDVRPDRVLVLLGGRPVSCTYSMALKIGNSVLVFLPPGTTTSGVIQAVMG
ncbi:MAG: hypothetical protein EOM17_05540 [Synergistales bacterium]|nr:hypothetical protein [Synergistales bacterium]